MGRTIDVSGKPMIKGRVLFSEIVAECKETGHAYRVCEDRILVDCTKDEINGYFDFMDNLTPVKMWFLRILFKACGIDLPKVR
jgi:hypothetical protein